jgi:hypothetical protein
MFKNTSFEISKKFGKKSCKFKKSFDLGSPIVYFQLKCFIKKIIPLSSLVTKKHTWLLLLFLLVVLSLLLLLLVQHLCTTPSSLE